MAASVDPQVVTAAAAHAQENPEGVLGVLLMVVVLVTLSIGHSVGQIQAYFNLFPWDSIWLKLLVGFSGVLFSLAQLTVILYRAWSIFVLSFGDWIAVVNDLRPISVEHVLAQAITFLGQLFYAYRCFVLTQRNWGVLSAIVLASAMSTVLFGIADSAFGKDPYNKPAYGQYAIPASIISAASHVVVTAIIVWQLSKAENTFQSTNTLLAELRRMSWQIALPPAVSSIIAIAMLCTQPEKNDLYCLFTILTSRLYVCCLLATLNTRAVYREQNEGAVGSDTLGPNRAYSSNTDAMKVHIHTTSITMISPKDESGPRRQSKKLEDLQSALECQKGDPDADSTRDSIATNYLGRLEDV